MTRPSANRRNRNARRIAALIPAGASLVAANHDGAFTADGTRRFTTAYLGAPGDTNWPYCAELLNRKANALRRIRNVRWEQPAGAYHVIVDGGDYVVRSDGAGGGILDRPFRSDS